MNKILDVVEEIKQNITDSQYKTIMDSLIKINDNGNKLPLLSENQERNKFVCLFNWLDTKLEITDNENNCIKKIYLQNYVINNYFYYFNNRTYDFVKQILKIYFTFSTKKQSKHFEYQYVKYRN